MAGVDQIADADMLAAAETKAGKSPDFRKIAIVGFGYIGCVIGAVLADRGCRVTGIDPDKRIRDTVREGRSPFGEPELEEVIARGVNAKALVVTADMAAIADSDVILVCVGTPLGQNQAADLSAVKRAFAEMTPYLNRDQLIILKSTLPPGTTEKIAPTLRRHHPGIRIAFCPERLAEGQALKDFLTIPVIVGGVDRESTECAAAFFRALLPVEVIEVSSATAAEMSKLADNLWIDLDIALANEIAKLSDKLGIDALEVIEAANSLPKLKGHVNILLPSVGVGGYCLTKDPWFVHAMGKTHGLDLRTPVASRHVNDTMPSYCAELILQHLAAASVQPQSAKVAVLGLAFKSNTGDCRYTPTSPAIAALRAAGCDLSVFDPWVRDEDAAATAGVQPAKSLDEAIADAHVIAFFTGHREFHEIDPAYLAERARPGALIFDGRMYFSRDKIEQIRRAGLNYKGVGW